jgi:hypothetical protein
LKLRPEPHGQGSRRPSFSINSLSFPTLRAPRLTWVSELKALPALAHRLAGKILILPSHGTPSFRNHFGFGQ